MKENFQTREKPILIREVCNLRSGGTEDPEELYRFIADSFGTGQEERYRLLKIPALTGEPLRHKVIDIKDLVAQFMDRLNALSPSPLGATGSAERELFSNLLTCKLAVEAAEVKRARLTGDSIGRHADMMWMEEQAEAAYPSAKEPTTPVVGQVESVEAEAVLERKIALTAVVEEWVGALEQYDLALRELQLEPGETVTQRFASFRRRVPDPLNRAHS